ncbi:MAG TPA: MaoC family dehydratase [Actinomycetota bacterium]|nr:MaoC family dehydratase [Actinomycetota bacterium]
MPAQVVLKGKDELLSSVGRELGVSDWYEVTQENVNLFADATGDHQWIHVDPEKAKAGPFGGTIAHGYFTLALAPMLSREVMTVDGVRMGINYGSNKVRYPSAVRVGAKLRLRVLLAAAEPVEPNGVQATYNFTFEVEGDQKPGCVAEVVTRYYF